MAKRVFFSFHYQDVLDFRANVVRQSWMTKPDREEAGFFDASIWEKTKLIGETSLKKLIDNGLDGTTVTAILIGSDTHQRRWVKYEIFKSIFRGNSLFGIHINQIRCKNRQTKPHGPDPFEYLALKFNSTGDHVQPVEWNGNQWIPFKDIPSWSLGQAQPNSAGNIKQLKNWSKTYCWVAHDGYNNFGSWLGE
jgi:hypothetical protein